MTEAQAAELITSVWRIAGVLAFWLGMIAADIYK